MSITPHPIADYKAALFVQIRNSEGFGLRNRPGLPYLDTATPSRATIGYGFNIEDGNAARLVLARLGLFAGKTDADVLRIEGEFRTAIRTGHGSHSALEASLDAFAVSHGVAGGKFRLSETQGEAIFNQILTGVPAGVLTGIGGSTINVEGKQERLNRNIDNTFDSTTGWSRLDINSKEYEALMSLFYNTESLVAKGSNLANAVIQGERVEAWYEIRYGSNADGQHAPRRIDESNLFSLYDNPGQGVGEAEAKEVLRMYTAHRPEIQAYESQFSTQFAPGGTVTIQFQLIGAETTMIALYAEGRTIDGEVLVGQDEVLPGDRLSGTTLNDLMFGEKGHDILKGEAGNDVLLGGDGTDQLTGGTGNDYLDGGAGYDTYIYRINDGQDTIRDTDGKGSVFYDGKLVVGGVRPADSTGAYTSLDGTFTFLQSGTDLIVNNLITLKNYMPGQMKRQPFVERMVA